MEIEIAACECDHETNTYYIGLLELNMITETLKKYCFTA